MNDIKIKWAIFERSGVFKFVRFWWEIDNTIYVSTSTVKVSKKRISPYRLFKRLPLIATLFTLDVKDWKEEIYLEESIEDGEFVTEYENLICKLNSQDQRLLEKLRV